MATVEQIYEGMSIFMKNGQKETSVYAEHDLIFGPEHEMLLSVDELEILDRAGWFVEYEHWVHHC